MSSLLNGLFLCHVQGGIYTCKRVSMFKGSLEKTFYIASSVSEDSVELERSNSWECETLVSYFVNPSCYKKPGNRSDRETY